MGAEWNSSVAVTALLLCLCCSVTSAGKMPAAGFAPQHIICSTDVYVRVGLEFEDCQRAALANLTTGGGGNPCPMVKRIIEVCADNVKICFDEKGWERGRQIFYDQLALNKPAVSQCADFFNLADITVREPGEKCSVAEEVASGREIGRCTNREQVCLYICRLVYIFFL
jgi:hypothetical protein